MKKGISYWSFGADLGNANPSYSSVFSLAKKLKFDSVEASISSSSDSIIKFDSKTAELKVVASEAKKAGVEISSLATGEFWGVPPTSNDTKIRAKASKLIKDQIRVAAELGCKTILIVPGAVQPQFLPKAEHVQYNIAWERAASAIDAALPVAEKYGVVIGIENVWNRFLLSPIEMRFFCAQFGSPYVKCYLDVGNVMFNGFPQDWIEILGAKTAEAKEGYLAAIHVKDFRTHFFLGNEKGNLVKVRKSCETIAKGSGWTGAYSFCDIGEGDLPQKEIIKALKKVGYKGYLTAEMLPPYKGVLAKTSKAMDKMLGKS